MSGIAEDSAGNIDYFEFELNDLITRFIQNLLYLYLKTMGRGSDENSDKRIFISLLLFILTNLAALVEKTAGPNRVKRCYEPIGASSINQCHLGQYRHMRSSVGYNNCRPAGGSDSSNARDKVRTCSGQTECSSRLRGSRSPGIFGINAALKAGGAAREFIVSRADGYLGVMIDDLVTRGVTEPYRMFTSRAEFRLRLRADNADQRLTPQGVEIGCVGSERESTFAAKSKALDDGVELLSACR